MINKIEDGKKNNDLNSFSHVYLGGKSGIKRGEMVTKSLIYTFLISVVLLLFLNSASAIIADSDSYEPSGLVARWSFNEKYWSGASGEVKDSLGVYNGTIDNGAKLVPMKEAFLSSPGSLTARQASQNRIIVNWVSAYPNPQYYRVYRAASQNLSYSAAGLLPSNVCSFVDFVFATNATQNYYVVAYKSFVESIPSKIANITTYDFPYTGLRPPGQFTADPISSSRIRISWNRTI